MFIYLATDPTCIYDTDMLLLSTDNIYGDFAIIDDLTEHMNKHDNVKFICSKSSEPYIASAIATSQCRKVCLNMLSCVIMGAIERSNISELELEPNCEFDPDDIACIGNRLCKFGFNVPCSVENFRALACILSTSLTSLSMTLSIDNITHNLTDILKILSRHWKYIRVNMLLHENMSTVYDALFSANIETLCIQLHEHPDWKINDDALNEIAIRIQATKISNIEFDNISMWYYVITRAISKNPNIVSVILRSEHHHTEQNIHAIKSLMRDSKIKKLGTNCIDWKSLKNNPKELFDMRAVLRASTTITEFDGAETDPICDKIISRNLRSS